MSIAAMNWAWRQALAPTLQLVLVALADAADDQGACWPSISTLARKCTVSTRTVQRSLRTLIDRGLLIAEPRQRRNGSRRLSRLPPEFAQQLLDELAARMKVGTIRVSPLVYLAGPIKRASAGEFVPEAGLRIAAARASGRRN